MVSTNNGTNASFSRGSMYPASSNGSNPSSVGCNRCGKKLTTTLFVCACDCVFCEGTLHVCVRVCSVLSIVASLCS